jgi:hypothetical protein
VGGEEGGGSKGYVLLVFGAGVWVDIAPVNGNTSLVCIRRGNKLDFP